MRNGSPETLSNLLKIISLVRDRARLGTEPFWLQILHLKPCYPCLLTSVIGEMSTSLSPPLPLEQLMCVLEHYYSGTKSLALVCIIVGDLGHQVSSFSELQFYHL